MILKRLLSFISIVLILTYISDIVTPALAVSITYEEIVTDQFISEEDYTIQDIPTEAEVYDCEIKPVFKDNGAIMIYNYSQLLLIGSGAELTVSDYINDNIGMGEPVFNGEDPVTYSLDRNYEIMQNILLPRHTVWVLPDGFNGNIYGESTSKKELYDPKSDTIYLYNPYQIAVMQMDNAEDQPVLTGDIDADTFGTGKPVLTDKDNGSILTYSGKHNYVISSQFDSEISNESISIRKKDPDESVDNGNADLEGRDFAGQVVKKINGVPYILIGNQEQLRAIGSNNEVFSAVYQVDYVLHQGYVVDKDNQNRAIQLYGGDADFLQSQNGYTDFSFQSINDLTHSGRYYTGVDQDTGQPYLDLAHLSLVKDGLTVRSWHTGQKL